jgi:hypothetical protein
MERIAADVRQELSRFGPATQLAEIVGRWPAAVGDGIARYAWPARLQRDGTLVVHASSSAWAFELTQLEPRVRESLGELAPPRLRFVPGAVPSPEPLSSAEATREPVPVSPEDRDAGSTLAAAIADEELRALVAQSAAASLSKARSARTF